MDNLQLGNSSDMKIKSNQVIQKPMEEFNEMDKSSAIELTSSKFLLNVYMKYQKYYKINGNFLT